MQEARLTGKNSFGDSSIKVDLKVFFFEEEGIFYAYMPSLDLTGYGTDEKSAGQSLKTMLDEFLSYTLNKNTLLPELQRLGWKIRSKNKPMRAPALSHLLQSNEQLKEIVHHKQYTTSSYEVNVPAYA